MFNYNCDNQANKKTFVQINRKINIATEFKWMCYCLTKTELFLKT